MFLFFLVLLFCGRLIGFWFGDWVALGYAASLVIDNTPILDDSIIISGILIRILILRRRGAPTSRVHGI